MVSEAIILAGGLGTRLKSVSGETPKPLVEVSGNPFVFYVLDNLISQGVSHIVFAVSYKADFFIQTIGDHYKSAKITYSIETSALGTGGAISQALNFCESQYVLITNGDTFLEVNLKKYLLAHLNSGKKISIALTLVNDVARYGSVNVNNNLEITGFSEKGISGPGLINGGMYLVDRTKLSLSAGCYSFEETYLKVEFSTINPFICNGYFIDIGIPDDYYKACKKFIK